MNEPLRFPFSRGPGLALPVEEQSLQTVPGLARVLLRSGHQAWFATRYADVRAVLADARFSRAAGRQEKQVARHDESFALHTADPPVHSKRRRAVLHAFTGKRVAALRPELERSADDLLVRAIESGPPLDLVGQFTIPFALIAICRVLGIPLPTCPSATEQPFALFRECVSVLMSANTRSAEATHEAHRQLDDYFRGLLESKRAELARGLPSDGLLADLLSEAGSDQGLSPDEILAHATGLMIAGHETTGNVLGIVLYVVLTRPGLRDRLRAAPQHIPAAIEETLRWISHGAAGGCPVHVALEDVVLRDGVVIRAGELVIPALDAANWDSEVFDQPEHFDPSRESRPHLAFGWGPHTCLGAALARAELTVALEVALRRLPEVVVDAAGLRWRTDMWIGGLWELPVQW